MKTDNATETEIMAVLKKFAEYYTKRDMEGVISLIAPGPDVVLYGTEADGKRIGLEGIWTH